METAVVLLSGGLDSTVNLYWAHKGCRVQCALTVNYGQRAYQRELEAAKRSCARLGIAHRILDLQPLFRLSESSLLQSSRKIPVGDQVDIADLATCQETAKSVWVANRNGVLLNVAACMAESLGADVVIPGFNREEAETFPDNSADFVQTMNQSLAFSTQNQVRVSSYTQDLDKIEIMRKVLEFEIPLDDIWSCYLDGEKPCGECESCLRFDRAWQACQKDL